MIKVTELMINDWVSINDSNYLVKDIKKKGVIKLYENTQWGENEIEFNTDYLEEFIQPIPLTPEILEKNFGKPYSRGGFHNYRMEKDETIAFVIEDRRVSATPNNRVVFCLVPGTYICDVNYVHELQHALKLCKIEKEIVL